MKNWFARLNRGYVVTACFALAVLFAVGACVATEDFIKMATGNPPFAGHIDPAKGLVVVEYYSDASGENPKADATGLVKTFARYCGADIAPQLENLKHDVQYRIQLSQQIGIAQPYTCVGDVCSNVAFGEYDVTGDYTFKDGKLRSVAFIEGGPVTESFRRDGQNWAKWFTTLYDGSNCPGY